MNSGKFVLDMNCYVDASHSAEDAIAFAEFCAWAAPGLYLSTVVAAELRAGAATVRDRRALDRDVLSPFVRLRRVVNPSSAAWHTLGTTLARLADEEGLVLRDVRRSFVFDILIAGSCRDAREIPRSRIVIDRRRWDRTLRPMLEAVRRDLGVAEGIRLTADLHNLLVCQPGQFFLAHQDSV